MEMEIQDHIKLGSQYGIFSKSEAVGAGLALWHPAGAVIRHQLEAFSQAAHMLNDYQWVYTPHIGRAGLWETSGHLSFYKDAMYSPMEIDGEKYYLKPMNCPFHIEIYNSQLRSYRDLPVRLAEFGTVYRYELSGALHGLTRVRGFTQDDAHIICTPEQIEQEVVRALKFSLYVLRAFGLEAFTPYISTKPEKKYVGCDEDWRLATQTLQKAASACGLEWRVDEGGGAFYGPKIDLKVNDAFGREWQLSTIQFDFNLPERFHMRYIAADGQSRTPYMVHRALFGSVERFVALLLEHYQGCLPFWLTPVQAGIVPIRPEHNGYCQRLAAQLKNSGLRVENCDQDMHMREKIKRFQLRQVPYILIVGDRDVSNGGFSVRHNREGEMGQMDIPGFLQRLEPELKLGRPQYIMDEI